MNIEKATRWCDETMLVLEMMIYDVSAVPNKIGVFF